MRRILLAAAFLLIPVTAFAQTSPVIELTPFGGYRWGGTIRAADTNLFTHDVDVKGSSAYGLFLDVPLYSNLQVELMADRQESRLTQGDVLFGGTTDVADINVTYYHVGLLWQFDSSPNVKPYFAIGAGVTELDLKVPGTQSETRGSGSVAGGVKVMFNRNFGMRLEGRGYWTDTSSSDNHYWGRYHDLNQGEAKFGFIFAF